jgi:hypothetical protein
MISEPNVSPRFSAKNAGNRRFGRFAVRLSALPQEFLKWPAVQFSTV